MKIRCAKCKGSGHVSRKLFNPDIDAPDYQKRPIIVYEKCDKCLGTGKIQSNISKEIDRGR